MIRGEQKVEKGSEKELDKSLSASWKDMMKEWYEFLEANGNIEDFELLSSGQKASLNSMAFKDQFKLVSISGKIVINGLSIIPILSSALKTILWL